MAQLSVLAQPELVSIVADRLRDAIARGQFQPGQRLIQEDLAQLLGISREPIRQALRLLQAEGLVVHRPRRGVIVAPLEEGFVRDVYDVRAGIDGIAARRTAGRLDDKTEKRARRILLSGRSHLERHNIPALLQDDRAFHLLILEASGNRVALDLVRAQWNLISVVMRAVLDTDYATQAWREHQEILHTIIAGDEDRAEQLARQHAWRAADMLSRRLKAIEATTPLV